MFKQYEGMRGNWQDQYSWLYRDILHGFRPPRHANVNLAAQNGLGECLSCIATVFYVSPLTSRALLIANEYGAPDKIFSVAYSQPNANPASLVDLTSVRVDDLTTRGQPPIGANVDMFRNGSVRNIGEDTEVVIFENCNAGLVVELCNNHRQEIFDMGTHLETAFGCAFWYLFESSQKVLVAFQEELSLISNRSLLKIGLQTRTKMLQCKSPISESPLARKHILLCRNTGIFLSVVSGWNQPQVLLASASCGF